MSSVHRRDGQIFLYYYYRINVVRQPTIGISSPHSPQLTYTLYSIQIPKLKALFLEGVGGNFVVQVTEIYKPGPGELLVKIKATGLNPADWKVQKFETGLVKFPAILGFDIAGDVVELGEGAGDFVKGDKIFFQGDFQNRAAGFQQYVIIDAKEASNIPTGWSYDKAVTIPLPMFTAWKGMYGKTGLGLTSLTAVDKSPKGKYANTPILIFGGPSAVGQMAIQLVKFSECSPIITTSALKHESYLKSLGATHLIDRHFPLSSLASEVTKISTEPVKFAFNAIASPELVQAGYDLLANGGTITIYTMLKIKETEGTGKRVGHVIPLPKEEVKAVHAMLTAFLEAGELVSNASMQRIEDSNSINSSALGYTAEIEIGLSHPDLSVVQAIMRAHSSQRFRLGFTLPNSIKPGKETFSYPYPTVGRN